DDGEKLIALMEMYGIEPGLDKQSAKTARVGRFVPGTAPDKATRDLVMAGVNLEKHPRGAGKEVGNGGGAVAQATRERARPPLDQAWQRRRCGASRAWQVVPLCHVEVDGHGHPRDPGRG